jgi:hypothetical protein
MTTQTLPSQWEEIKGNGCSNHRHQQRWKEEEDGSNRIACEKGRETDGKEEDEEPDEKATKDATVSNFQVSSLRR